MSKPSAATSRPSGARPLADRMFEPVDSCILIFVRIVLGITIYSWASGYLSEVPYGNSTVPLYEATFLAPQFLFKYWGFEWVQLWPGDGMHWHFVLTMIAAGCLAVGLLTRLSAGILCASIAYVLLVERRIYVNHYYLIACAAGLLVFLPAGRRFSFDSLFNFERHETTFARWQLWLIRFQFGLPYVFGAIAKLNSDWFNGQPSGIILANQAKVSVIGPYLTMTGAKEIMAFGGFFYDLLIVPMLLYKPTRWLAVLLSLIFHLTNAALLNIGVFPWFMLSTLVVFFPPDALPKLLAWTRQHLARANPRKRKTKESLVPTELKTPKTRLAKAGLALAITYVVIQLLLPIRPWIFPGNPHWNERGHRFAWRMMLRKKTSATVYLAVHRESGKSMFVPSTAVMTPYQARGVDGDPELIRQGAVEVKKRLAKSGYPGSKIYALALVSLNGRQPKPIIDPTVDLATARPGWFVDDWVLQDPGPFREIPWQIPKDRWLQTLELPEPFKPLGRPAPAEPNG